MEVDEALSRLGKFGKWQMFTYTLVCLSVTVSGCWHMMVVVFTGGEPNHHCKIPPNSTVNNSIPWEFKHGKWKLSKCLMYSKNESYPNETMSCNDGWYYDPEYDSTIVTEWNLVCDKNYLVETSQSVFVAGVMVGAVLFTTLADKYGRKPVHLGCQWAMVVIGVGLSFAPEFISFAVLRFIQGAVREGAGLAGIVMACEIFPAAQRTFAGTALELFWAGSWMVLAGIAYFIRNWRYLQLTISIPPIITIALIWLVPESIPWLAANGKVHRAEKILKKAAKMNKVTLPEHILVEHEAKQLIAQSQSRDAVHNPDFATDEVNNTTQRLNVNDGHIKGNETTNKDDTETYENNVADDDNAQPEAFKYNCMDILRSKTMLLYAFVMCFLWAINGIVYYGLSFSTSTLAGDKYLNFFLSGAVEAPAYMTTVIVLQKWGRRWPLVIFHIIAGIPLLINVFLPEKTAGGTDLTPLIVTLAMIGKFGITAAFGEIVLYAPEIYPTNLRNVGFGLASCAGRAATMLAPFSSYLGKMIPWLPSVIFSALSILGGLSTLLLPETLNRPLPETIEEIEAWKRTPPPTNREMKEMYRKDHEKMTITTQYGVRVDDGKDINGETKV